MRLKNIAKPKKLETKIPLYNHIKLEYGLFHVPHHIIP